MHTIPSLPVNLAIIRRSGEIASVNDGWKRFGRHNGLETARFGLGKNYLDYCKPADGEATQSLERIRALLSGDVDLVSFPYRCNSPHRKRAFVLIGIPLSQGSEASFVLLHINVSAMLGRNPGSETSSAVELSTLGALADHLARIHAPSVNSGGSERAALLTEKEREVLELLGQGMTNKEIAALLSRSPNRIKIHVSHILEKLNLRSRTEAALTSFKFSSSDYGRSSRV